MNSRDSGDFEAKADLRPWAAVPAEVAELLRPALPEAIDAAIRAVAQAVPAYEVEPDRDDGPALATGVQVALERLLHLLGQDSSALGPAAEVYQQIGAGEYRAGRALESVLAAYRVGATATWRAFSRTAVEAGVQPLTVAVLADACFAYIDEIASASVAGYTDAANRDAGRRERSMRLLIDRLLAGQGSTPGAAEIAGRLGWRMPSRVRVALLDDGARAPVGGLMAETDAGTVAVLTADGPGRDGSAGRRAWTQAARSGSAWIGSAVPISDAPVSLDQARLLQRVLGRGAHAQDAPAPGACFLEDHLPVVILHSRPDLAQALAARWLAPLQDLPADRAEVVAQTLLSWLRHDGSRAEVAAELSVHPQTVAYRMERVRELFGEALSDPESRFALQLALRAAFG